DRLSSSTTFENAGGLRGAGQRRIVRFVREQENHRPCLRVLDAGEEILPEGEEVARAGGCIEPRGSPGRGSAEDNHGAERLHVGIGNTRALRPKPPPSYARDRERTPWFTIGS